MSKQYSISILIENEPITIGFKDLKMGLKIAQALKTAFPESKAVPEQEHLEQMKYMRSMSSFALQQPQFVDVFNNQLDHRISIPSNYMTRTLVAATDNQSVQELLSLAKMKPQTAAPIPSRSTAQQPVSAQGSHQEQIYRLVYQILIYVFSKDPVILNQAALQAGIKLDKNDPAQLSNLVKATTQRFMHYPTQEMLQKLQEYQNIPIEMKEKIQELINSTQQQQGSKVPQLQLPALPQLPQPPKYSLPQPVMHSPQPVQLTSQLPTVQLSSAQQIQNKVNQAAQVMQQLEPIRISQLIHFPIPKMLKTFNYLEPCSAINLLVTRNGYESQVLDENVKNWKARIDKEKHYQIKETELSAKILKLYEKQSNQHKQLVEQHDVSAFHKLFTRDENILLLCLMQSVIIKEGHFTPHKILNFAPLQQSCEQNVQLTVFDALQKLIEQHKQSTTNPFHFPTTARNEMPKPEPPRQRQIIQHQPVIQQPQPAPKPQPTDPAIPSKIQFMSPEFKQQIMDIYVKLIGTIDPMVIAKAIVLVVGLGATCQFNAPLTHAFFENALMSIYKANSIEITQEKLFIVLTGIVPSLVHILASKSSSANKQLCYKATDENLPKFDAFFANYVKEVQSLNQTMDRAQLIEQSTYIFLNDYEIRQVLMYSNDKIIAQVVQKIGLSAVVKKEEPESKQQQIRSAFGVERSETDSEDM